MSTLTVRCGPAAWKLHVLRIALRASLLPAQTHAWQAIGRTGLC